MVKVKPTPEEIPAENSKVVYWVDAAVHQLVDTDYRRTGTRPTAEQIVQRITAVTEGIVK